MKRANQILPVYTVNISGVYSILYEPDGVTAMHGASGRNSTYATHDESRWYSMDSMVYISALSELEAVVGDDEKLVRDIVDMALNLCPVSICIGRAPIPMTMGTGFKGIAGMVENKTGISTFGIATNRMHSYVHGAEEAPRWIVKQSCPPGIRADRPAALEVNILRVAPLDFSLTRNTARLKDFLRSHGMETVGRWAAESGPDELRLTGLANMNLVVSAVGLPAIAEPKKMYGAFWVVGTSMGRRTPGRLTEYIQQAARTGENQDLFDGAGYMVSQDADACIRPDLGLVGLSKDLSSRKVLIIGEQVVAGSLRRCLREEWGAGRVIVLCPTEEERVLALEGDIIDWNEDEIIRAITENTVVVADPLYRQVCPTHRNIVFIDFSHEACSDRMYHSIMRPFACAPDDLV